MSSAVSHSLLVSRPTRLSRFLVVSVVGHVAVVAAALFYAGFTSAPKVNLDQKPINASLVRLGKPRDPKLLPRKEVAQPPPKEVVAKPTPT
ncbi:energy transducer TonB, partial [Corallococcus sp. CA054B]